MSFLGEQNFEHKSSEKIGVLLCNLGTPDSFQTSDVRKFLKEFLSDGRVVEIPKFLWWFILNGIILIFRPKKSAKLYESVWTKEGSPLMVYSEKLVNKLSKELPDNYEIKLAMRYRNPSIEESLISLKKKNCRNLIVLPLFPQYSGTTTGSVFDEVSRVLSKWRWVPKLNFVNSYHDDEGYITAITESIKDKLEINSPQKIIFSYHGIPKKNFTQGDPYHCFCKKTSRLVAERLGLGEEKYMTAFQSRFGRAEWLKPYTSETMERLPAENINNILVVAPGFSVDCLETIEEIDEENKEIFIDAGGKTFNYVSCLNDSDLHVSFIKNFLNKQISIWK